MSKKMQAIDPSERVKIAQLQSEIKQDSEYVLLAKIKFVF